MGISKEVIKKDCNGNILKTYNSCKDAANELGIKIYDLTRKIKKHTLIKGYYYEYTGITSKIIVDNSDKLKCPYCDFYAKNYNGLCKHVFKHGIHDNITKEQLLTDVKYNGIRPTCKCGCGEYTTIINTNGAHFADYVQGHWNRIINNWGHNLKAKENSANVRREQYLSGERQQWNKGKKWDETYSIEEQVRLRNNLIEKMSKRIENSSFSISSKLEDDFIKDFIEPYTTNYKRQFYLSEIKQFCDLYLPENKIIIEINGGYWHCDRRLYDKPINDIQKEKIKRDEIKYKYLRDNGFLLIVIWEQDIKNNREKVKYLIDKIFVNNNWKCEVEKFLSTNSNLKKLNVDLIDLTFDNELKTFIKKDTNSIKIFEDEWLYKKEIVKSRLLNAASLINNKIYARKCVIKNITYDECSEFLEENHLQGKIAGLFYYGLYYDDTIVSVMVFGRNRKNLGNHSSYGEYELLRFCSIIGVKVVGAAGKLFKNFVKEVKPNKIISYCDKRWGDGVFYEKIGMKFSHETQCNYFYVNEIERKRENRFKYRKDVLVKMGFEIEKSERQIMIERGIYRVYDCGCKVFIYKNDK